MLVAIMIAAQLSGINPNLLFSVCQHESRGNVRALAKHDGKTPSYGICQIKLATAKFMGFGGSAKELMNPETNAYFAAKYLAWQLDRYHGDEYLAVAAYNAGSAGKGNTAYVLKVHKLYTSIK